MKRKVLMPAFWLVILVFILVCGGSGAKCYSVSCPGSGGGSVYMDGGKWLGCGSGSQIIFPDNCTWTEIDCQSCSQAAAR